jgi:hypothetical protein
MGRMVRMVVLALVRYHLPFDFSPIKLVRRLVHRCPAKAPVLP